MDILLKTDVKSCLIGYLASLKNELNNSKQRNASEVLLSWIQEDINKVEKVLKQLQYENRF